jgi:hypothetical protein
VFARWTSGRNRATDAPYTINHAGGPITVPVNQEANGGVGFSLGVYFFNIGPASIVLSDDADSIVIADAIRAVFVGS